MKMPHGDMQPMAYHMDDATLVALEQIDQYVEPFLYHLPTMIVYEDKMLAMARRGYSCSTELANELVRHHDLDYRTAHDVVNRFVSESAKQAIPSSEADLGLFQETAEKLVGKKLDRTETRLRELLDPVYFVTVTNSRGGVALAEVARMITDRRNKLDEARARHLMRIEGLEQARERMLSDLRAIYEASGNGLEGKTQN
jgi:argininosuccinate lyase